MDIPTLIKATRQSGRPPGMHQPFEWGATSRCQRRLYSEPPLDWFPNWHNFNVGQSIAIYEYLSGGPMKSGTVQKAAFQLLNSLSKKPTLQQLEEREHAWHCR